MYFSKRQYYRSSSVKITLLILIFILVILHTRYFHKKNGWCDPEKELWWFCSSPGNETICSWNKHFPTIDKNNRSPESYEQLLLSLPKVQSSFQFNNLTFQQCTEQSIDLLIFVISKCSHASIRQSIRRTWANTNLLQTYFPQLTIKLLFLVDIDTKSREKIILESNYHNDIVQVINLPEQYEYVTKRESALYEFVLNKCKQTKFIFKTDDDIFINTFLLLSKLNSFQNLINKRKTKYLLFGYPIDYGLVVRHTNSYVGQRYIITKDEYSCPRYPTFLSGFGYLMTREICSLFFHAYQTDMKPFPLSDVYFTGLLAEMFNIQRLMIFPNVKYLYQTKCNENFFNSNKYPFACAASNNHFNEKNSDDDRSLMNDYNLFWIKLAEKYRTLETKENE
ncbi:unnamed protein product [Adineta steineri]|uniref:Hexosyltransferase n=1 Tax=Adineta steineri TaxID=433720 RepID=A0A818ZGP1_9BILA|nr:unnamed protein product [Adineta steineri]CAF3771593.1 unnamed protein product [Adineta steineri]